MNYVSLVLTEAGFYMKYFYTKMIGLAVFSVIIVSCSKPSGTDVHPPDLVPAEKPAPFMQTYDLIPEHSILYENKGSYTLKTSMSMKSLEEFYLSRLEKFGFELLMKTHEASGLLLQGRKNNEVLSIDLRDLPYSTNHLVKMGYSKVKPKKEKPAQ